MRVPWDKRGTRCLEQLPDWQPQNLRCLSDYDLFRFIAGYESKTGPHMAGLAELRRRENSTARWALAIAFLSLVASVAAIVMKVS